MTEAIIIVITNDINGTEYKCSEYSRNVRFAAGVTVAIIHGNRSSDLLKVMIPGKDQTFEPGESNTFVINDKISLRVKHSK